MFEGKVLMKPSRTYRTKGDTYEERRLENVLTVVGDRSS
jgi:hypothetical protein